MTSIVALATLEANYHIDVFNCLYYYILLKARLVNIAVFQSQKQNVESIGHSYTYEYLR